jgi:hypothetical protein
VPTLDCCFHRGANQALPIWSERVKFRGQKQQTVLLSARLAQRSIIGIALQALGKTFRFSFARSGGCVRFNPTCSAGFTHYPLQGQLARPAS